jgi:hypothetical protein
MLISSQLELELGTGAGRSTAAAAAAAAATEWNLPLFAGLFTQTQTW